MRPKHILPVLFLLSMVAGGLGVAPLKTVSAQSACAGVPFTDVSTFCAEIRIAYYTGITLGTTATTYSTSNPVTRDTMAAFTTRTLNFALLRGSPRSAVGFLWSPGMGANIGTVGTSPAGVASDGVDLWIADGGSQKLFRVSHNGNSLATWTGLSGASDVLVVPGRVIVTGTNVNIYAIDPSQAAGQVTPSGTSPSAGGVGLAFDGQKVWRPSAAATTLSLLNPDGTYVAEFGPLPTPTRGIFFDGTYMWVVSGTGNLRQINPATFAFSDVSLGATFSSTVRPGFDGENLWVPNPDSNQIFIVRPSSDTVIATVTGNGLNGPNAVAFDGLRMLVTNKNGNSVSLFQATDQTPLGSISLSQAMAPSQAASDGINFFVIGSGNAQLWKF